MAGRPDPLAGSSPGVARVAVDDVASRAALDRVARAVTRVNDIGAATRVHRVVPAPAAQPVAAVGARRAGGWDVRERALVGAAGESRVRAGAYGAQTSRKGWRVVSTNDTDSRVSTSVE